MKIIIFGATGTIGRHLIEQGLDEGHRITAFARTPEKLFLEHPNLSRITGDVLSRDSVTAAIPGHDAVIVVLGAGIRGNVRSKGTLNIINAMQTHNIQRLICQSTLGAGDSRKNLNFFWKYIMFGGLLRKAYADHQLQEHYVRASGLDWTIVRPGAFTNGQRTGEYRHGFPASDKSTLLKVSRPDVAEFLLKQISDLKYLHSSPGLSY